LGGGPAGLPGDGIAALPDTVPAEVAGLKVYHQGIILDSTYGFAVTNGLELCYVP
jgi:hypothetical protein